jgi:hypothetical protein
MIYFVLIGQFMVYCVQSISKLHHILRTAYALFCGRFMFNGTETNILNAPRISAAARRRSSVLRAALLFQAASSISKVSYSAASPGRDSHNLVTLR